MARIVTRRYAVEYEVNWDGRWPYSTEWEPPPTFGCVDDALEKARQVLANEEFSKYDQVKIRRREVEVK